MRRGQVGADAVGMWWYFEVGRKIMNIRSRIKDTLIRRYGKVSLLRSEGSRSFGSGD